MNRTTQVYMELQGENCLVGTLWTRQKGGRESASFELEADEAQAIVGRVGSAVADWKHVAASVGIPLHEMRRMASAFEHDDLARATRHVCS